MYVVHSIVTYTGFIYDGYYSGTLYTLVFYALMISNNSLQIRMFSDKIILSETI